MGFYRIGLPLWAIALTAAAWGCAPQVTTDEGKATQAAEGDGDSGPGTPANDPDQPPKDPPPGGGCDTGASDPPPKDPGQPGACVGVLVGDGATCTPDADLKQQAMDACTAQSMALQEIHEGGDCGGNEFTIAKVLCCGPGGGDPPPPQNCTGFAIGDNVTCTPDADLKQQAMDACTAQGMAMQGIYEAFDCPGTESTMAKVLCCAPASP